MGAFVIIVGVILMVIIHEGGHFLAAKAFDMKATQAFFGFGPRIWSITRGETEYGVKALPLGGYVRIIGMNPFEEVDPEEEDRTYRRKPFWQKSIVVLAGIFSHIVVAFFLFWVVSWVWGTTFLPSPEQSTTVTRVVQVVPIPVTVDDPIDLPMEDGDIVLTIDGFPLLEAPTAPDKGIGELTTVVVERDGTEVVLETTDMIVPSAAKLSGAQVGDVIVGVDGQEVKEWNDFTDAIHDKPQQQVVIDVERDGTVVTLGAVLTTRTRDGEQQGFYGVAPSSEVGPIRAIPVAARNTVVSIGAAAYGLWDLVANFGNILQAAVNPGDVDDDFQGSRPVSVIGLVRIAGPLETGLVLLAFVNVFVGVLNVVPLYPLDGGHFAVALYEKIRGRSADVRKLVPIAAAVFIFIVMLGLLGLYLDIVDPISLGQ